MSKRSSLRLYLVKDLNLAVKRAIHNLQHADSVTIWCTTTQIPAKLFVAAKFDDYPGSVPSGTVPLCRIVRDGDGGSLPAQYKIRKAVRKVADDELTITNVPVLPDGDTIDCRYLV